MSVPQPPWTTELHCSRCGSRFPAAPHRLDCPHCRDSAVLVAERDILGAVGAVRPRSIGIWSTAALLPDVPIDDRVSLGEGQTPIIPLHGRAHVSVKFEAINPTQSYKDRFNAVNMSVARAWRMSGVALISTGNAGLAAAAYGAAAGIAVRVFCSPDTPAFLQFAIRDFGAELHIGPPERLRADLEASIADGYLPGSRSVPFSSVTPFGAEGYSTIAAEIVADLGDAPPVVVVPVGGGDGIFGIGRGFERLHRAALSSRVPVLIGARTASPLAPSISGDVIGEHAVESVRRSGGQFVEVDEASMHAAVGRLLDQGLSAEPASATSVAVALELGLDDAVCVVTGGGHKWRELS